MAASLLPIIAIAGAAFFLMRKKVDGGEAVVTEPHSTGASGPDWSKPTPEDAPGTSKKIALTFDIQLRMGTGGNIEKAIIDAPDGSNPEEDLRLEEGEGHERIVLGFNKAGGQWAVTLKGTRGDTGEYMERTWVLEPTDYSAG